MNTVGKPGKLGENIKCVVSVSMLTEGWDANTVTHILGVRAFGTQLLCEQVVGARLRRMRYAANVTTGQFDLPSTPKSTVCPFRSFPVQRRQRRSKTGPNPDPRPRALDRPRPIARSPFRVCSATGYDLARQRRLDGQVHRRFQADALDGRDIPTKTENAPIVGESTIHTLDDPAKRAAFNEVAFLLAKLTLDKYFRDGDSEKPVALPKYCWPFAQLRCRRWLAECVALKDNTFPQLLLLAERAHDAADHIYRSIVASTDGAAALVPILRPYDATGSTRYVDFDTIRPTYATRADRCHVSHVVADTGSWEQKMAESLEEMAEVIRYVKNQNMGFVIPYTLSGEEKRNIP